MVELNIVQMKLNMETALPYFTLADLQAEAAKKCPKQENYSPLQHYNSLEKV